MSPRLKALLVGGDGGGSALADAGLLLLRLMAGLGLVFGHGLQKLPPSAAFVAGVGEMGFLLPGLFAWAAALSEVVGGFLIALGLLTRPAGLFVACTMLTAAFVRNAGEPFGERELALLYLAVALALMLTGSGRYGPDAFFRRRDGDYVRRFRR